VVDALIYEGKILSYKYEKYIYTLYLAVS